METDEAFRGYSAPISGTMVSVVNESISLVMESYLVHDKLNVPLFRVKVVRVADI